MLKKFTLFAVLLAAFVFGGLFRHQLLAQVQNPQSGNIGIEGNIPTNPPTSGATISFPTNGQVFTDTPIDVSGICPDGLVVKLFKNNVFAGSVQCSGGTFTITADLFNGQNILIARVYDSLDQAGPDSSPVTITFNSGDVSSALNRVFITTNFAKRGADPGTTLSWPISITGGVGPYALNVDWGDGNEDLSSLSFAGETSPEHVYDKPGTYRIIFRVTDSQGSTGFLQVIGVANGDLDTVIQSGASQETPTKTVIQVIRWPLYFMFFFMLCTFWLGRRYELKRLKQKLASQEYNYYR